MMHAASIYGHENLFFLAEKWNSEIE